MMHFSQAGTGLNEFCTSFSRVALYGNQIANGAGTRSGNGPTNQNPNRLFCTHDIKPGPGNFSVRSLSQVSGEIYQEKVSQLSSLSSKSYTEVFPKSASSTWSDNLHWR